MAPPDAPVIPTRLVSTSGRERRRSRARTLSQSCSPRRLIPQSCEALSEAKVWFTCFVSSYPTMS